MGVRIGLHPGMRRSCRILRLSGGVVGLRGSDRGLEGLRGGGYVDASLDVVETSSSTPHVE